MHTTQQKFEETAIIIKQEEIADDIYSMWLEKHPDIKKLPRLPAGCNNYCNIGKTYMLSEQYDYAEEYLKTASFMVGIPRGGKGNRRVFFHAHRYAA